MSEKNTEKPTGASSWLRGLMRPSYLLIGTGILVDLAATGQVKVGSFFEFSPLAAGLSGAGRAWLGLLGSLTLVLGASLALYEKGVFAKKVAVLYAIATAAVLLVFGVVGRFYGGSTQMASDSTMTVPLTRVRFIDNWQASDIRFQTEVASELLRGFANKDDLVLICRLYDPDTPIGDDNRIVVSKPFPIEPVASVQSVAVPLDSINARLHAGDQVECGLALLPKAAHPDQLDRMRDVAKEGGRILGYAHDDVMAVAGAPPGD